MAKPPSADSILKKMKGAKDEVRTPIGTEIYLPNLSGDLSAGNVRTTPTQDLNPVNKKYVDDEIVANAWLIDTAQTGLTGDKTGSFNLTTSGDIDASDGSGHIRFNTGTYYIEFNEWSANLALVGSDHSIYMRPRSAVVGWFGSEGFNMYGGKGFQFGSSGTKHMYLKSDHVNQDDAAGKHPICLMLGLQSLDWTSTQLAARTFLICDDADITYNFGHEVQLNPTIIMHSANQSQTEWLSIAHDQTNGQIRTGAGGLQAGEKTMMTRIGGLAIQLTNKTGANSVAGGTVKVYTTTAVDDAVMSTAADDNECFGVFLDSGISDGSEAWVVVGGIADVAMEDNTAATRGNWVQTSETEAGYGDATDVSPQAAPQHFNEIGHCIESVAAGGEGTHILARCVLHFN